MSSPDPVPPASSAGWLRTLLHRLTAPCEHGQPVTVAVDPVAAELDERSELLRFSYQEVLDATKHQDDKINRLLTTVAFITAAALAMTTLGHDSAPITATFLLDGRIALPLASIGLAGFLAGVAASVILLIVSMTTPLVLPGRASQVNPPIRYVPGPETGQSYFNEISRTALPGWYHKWQQDPALLKQERNDSLVRETHNLAVRTEYKYQRSNEAVAVLSFALLSFVLSAVLILVAAEREDVHAPLTTNLTVRLVLGLIFFGYCLLQLLASQRSQPPAVLDLAYPPRRLRLSVQIWGRLYVLVASLVAPQLLLLPSEPAGIRLTLAIAVPVLAWLLLGFALPWYSEQGEFDQRAVARKLRQSPLDPLPDLPPSTSQASARKHNAKIRRSWLAALVFAAGYAVFGSVTAQSSAHRELLGVSGAYAAGLLLAASAFWQIGRKSARRAVEFRQYVVGLPSSVQ